MQEFDRLVDHDKKQVYTKAVNAKELVSKMNDLKQQMYEDGHEETSRKIIGRNDKCPCGSGKKYKKCHLGTII